MPASKKAPSKKKTSRRTPAKSAAKKPSQKEQPGKIVTSQFVSIAAGLLIGLLGLVLVLVYSNGDQATVPPANDTTAGGDTENDQDQVANTTVATVPDEVPDETAPPASNSTPTPDEEETTPDETIEPASRNIIGSDGQEILVLEVYNFSCGVCARYHTTLAPLYQEYGNRITFRFIHSPPPEHSGVFPNAWLAHRAAEAAARQGKFREMHDLLFANFSYWVAARNTDDPLPKIEGFAKEIGLDMDKFGADLNSEEITEVIEKDRLYAQSLGITGTPTFFVNGQKVQTNSTFFGSTDVARQTLDELLKEAQE